MPDNQFILGEAPNLGGFFVGAGFNSVGLVFGRRCRPGPRRVDRRGTCRRETSSPSTSGASPLSTPTTGGCGTGWGRSSELSPTRDPGPIGNSATACSFRRFPNHPLLAGKEAVFGLKMGWERPNVFVPVGLDPPSSTTPGTGPSGSRGSAVEYIATRERVAVFDETSFGKLFVVGRDAETALQCLCTADVAVETGRAVYTGMLNERAGYEADVTVTRLARDRYLLVTSAASPVRDAAGSSGTSVGGRMSVVEILGVRRLGVMGPASRALLGPSGHGRPLRRGVPLLVEPGDRPRLRHGPGHPDHLRR